MYISIWELLAIVGFIYALMLCIAFVQKILFEKYWWIDDDGILRDHFTWKRFIKDTFHIK